MALALKLARRAAGQTSPNPLVGAVLVRRNRVIGTGYHHRAGLPHAEIEALNNARQQGFNPRGSTLYVTLEPCSSHGRTPPCTEAIIAAGIREVVCATQDPNPAHAGRGLRLLKRAGIQVVPGPLTEEATRINLAFNHWITRSTPYVTIKAAMTLDGKIATSTGESKWITSPQSRREGMRLRRDSDAILVGVNTILADNPSLTFRPDLLNPRTQRRHDPTRPLRRIILDTHARTPLQSTVLNDPHPGQTILVVSSRAPAARTAPLARKVELLTAPEHAGRIDLRQLLPLLGARNITSLLVEGGGEVNASFLLDGLAHRIVFFYAPKIIGGTSAVRAVAGTGVNRLEDALTLSDPQWRRLGPDLMLTAQVNPPRPRRPG